MSAHVRSMLMLGVGSIACRLAGPQLRAQEHSSAPFIGREMSSTGVLEEVQLMEPSPFAL